MSQDVFIRTLHDWQNFYTLVGEAVATLIGSQFVAASLGARLIGNDDTAAPACGRLSRPRLFTSPWLLPLSALMIASQPDPGVHGCGAGRRSASLGVGYCWSHRRRLRIFHRGAL